MKKFACYSEQITVDDENWTVTLIPEGTGTKTVFHAYLFDSAGHAKEMCAYPVDQRQAKIDPHVYTPDEIMDMALCDVDDYIGDLCRIEKFEEILFEHFVETDCIRAKNAEIYGQ